MKRVVIYTEGPSEFNLIAAVLKRFHKLKTLKQESDRWFLERKVDDLVDLQLELRCGYADSNQVSSDITSFINEDEAEKMRGYVSDLVDNDTTVLFIIDADIDIETRREEVRKVHQTKYFDVDSKLFLWPDDRTSNQEFEHLLPDIANIPEVFACWNGLETCINDIPNEYLGTTEQRAKVLRKHGYYSYNDFVRREKEFEGWNFAHPRLQNLIHFLNRHINNETP
jgi:hypothetical protein